MSRSFKFLAIPLLLVFMLSAMDADAQRRRRGAGGGAGGGATPPPQTDTTGNPQGSSNNTQPPGFDPYANLPVIYDTAAVEPVRPSLEQDNATDKSNTKGRTPLPYEELRYDDALYAEKVWREIDFREKVNKVFTYEAQEDDREQMFANIILNEIREGRIEAYADDRFSIKMDLAQVESMLGADSTVEIKFDLVKTDSAIAKEVRKKPFDIKSINKLRVKEEWVFDRESSRMFVRILGLCLLKTEKMPDNPKVERPNPTPLFWIYYPKIRPVLAATNVYNAKNLGVNRMTWEELFESRMFGSYIIKSTIDNPGNKTLMAMYQKDGILRLLEGENIKEKIFNFEQDLWSY